MSGLIHNPLLFNKIFKIMNTDGDSFSGIARLKSEIELMVNSLKPLDQNFYPIYPLTSKRGYYQKEIAIVYYQKEIAILYIIINYCI